MEHPKLLTAEEAALLLRCSRKALYTAVARKQIPGVVRRGRRLFLNEATVVAWLRAQERASSPD